MSHIHIPDGVLPLWLVVAGWIGAIALVALAVRRASTEETRRRVPLVGAMAALMLVGMSSEIIPIAYHINLTVLAGILLGPWLSIITALVVDVMLGLIGHGGVTVIGLNTMVISTEMILGWALFRAFATAFGPRKVGLAAGTAAVVALALSTTLLVAIVALGGSPAASRESGAFDPSTLSFSDPFQEGVVTNETLTGEDEHTAPAQPLSVARFAITVYLLGSIGWVLEGIITGLIVGFIAKVRPGLLLSGALHEPQRAPLGDEAVHR